MRKGSRPDCRNFAEQWNVYMCQGIMVVPQYIWHLLIYLENYVKIGGHVRTLGHTSSKGLVSLKQLSQTSFTARSADSLSLQLGLAITDNTARLRTHACEEDSISRVCTRYDTMCAPGAVLRRRMSHAEFLAPKSNPRSNCSHESCKKHKR